jgi:APA family basic amino acid/polyamine antiporter
MVSEIDVADSSGSRGLVRRLGLVTATALVVGEVIGTGIFLTPAEMAKALGSPLGLLLVWLTMGASAMGGALCFGALASRYPEAGGIYVYLREGYGRRMAFLYGWLSLLVTDPGLTAMLAVGMARYAGRIVPLAAWGEKAVALGAIGLLAAVNINGVALGSRVLGVLAALKLGLLGFIVAWGFSLGRGDWSNLTPFWSQRPGAAPLVEGLAVGLVGAFICYAGWWDLSKLAGELRDPRRSLPRALVLGLSIVTVVYIAVSAAFLYLVPPAQIASNEAFAAQAGAALFGRTGEVAFASVVVISVAGSLAAVLLASPRVYYAMARDGLFFRTFAAVDPRHGTPGRAIGIQAALAGLLVLTGSFQEILSYFMVPTLLFLVAAVAAVFVLRRRSPGEPPLKTPGYPVSPLLFLVPVVLVISLRISRDPVRSLIGLAVVVLGIPVSGRVVSGRRSDAPTVSAASLVETAVPAAAAGDPAAAGTLGVDS